MFPPLLYLVFLFGLLLCFPLGVFPLPVLVPSRFMRKKETSKTELVFAKEGLFSKFLKIFCRHVPNLKDLGDRQGWKNMV